ncbi:FecCD family ABC transporter permease [Paenibacillus harenae]|uniref:Iron complex transport system permease protein n=1 Tax=Paenibacillus harenae TaxID=306543 RepID=A0ABT9UA36_PAEHA|nr:iron ABC transporter permease [Paenibacillus harenae]MDQ0116518.1 iron complex transport system permease protein [Paenibacillus harenae]
MDELPRKRAMSIKVRFQMTIGILLIALAAFVILHLAFGRTMMSLEEVLKALLNSSEDRGQHHIVWNLRLPRVLIAIASGLMLGLAGAILQVIMRNPLAEPGLIGASAGSVLFVVLWMLYVSGDMSTNATLPFVALLGGVITVGGIYLLNGTNGNNNLRLVLTGVIVTSILQSATSLLLLKNQEGLASILLWNFGSLNGRVWAQWNNVWPWALVLFLLSMLLARKAALLQLGDSIAAGLGLPVNRTRLMLLLIAAALTAASVSVVGAIGFIGLIGPHIAGLLIGRNPVYLFPASALFSAVLLVAADWIGQSISLNFPLPGMEHHVTTLPVGAVTTLMGAPFFIFLLRRTLVKK